jgi:hypothetical protein
VSDTGIVRSIHLGIFNVVRYGRLMLTELFAQLTEEGSVTVYTADDCMTALEGVLVTDKYSNLWFMNRTFV